MTRFFQKLWAIPAAGLLALGLWAAPADAQIDTTVDQACGDIIGVENLSANWRLPKADTSGVLRPLGFVADNALTRIRLDKEAAKPFLDRKDALDLRGWVLWDHDPTAPFDCQALSGADELGSLAYETAEKGEMFIYLPIPGAGWKMWPRARLVVADVSDAGQRPAALVMTRFVSSKSASMLISIAFLFVLYFITAKAVARICKRSFTLNPVSLTQGISGRASIANLQILFFTMIVLGIYSYSLLRTGLLGDLSPDVLWLIGIGGAGSAAAKVTAVNKNRIQFENWSWLVKKHWIHRTPPSQQASWGHLVATKHGFDVYRFQTIAFSIVVGVSLLISGITGLAEFEIPETLLGLLGLSQVVYVGGKAVSTPAFGELDEKITKLRAAEHKILDKLARDDEWRGMKSEERTTDAARDKAPVEYHEYINEADEGAHMTAVLFGPAPADRYLAPHGDLLPLPDDIAAGPARLDEGGTT